jgi:hypothetical protein
MEKQAFFTRLQHDIEAATARLIGEGERELQRNGMRAVQEPAA